MSNTRFNGVLRTKVEDTGQHETRRVLILSPYVQTSEDNVDYLNSLVVDLQTQENEVVAQLEEMMKSEQANNSKTFLEYSQFAQFKNGDNVMKWLFDHKAIQKVSVDDVDIVMNGQSMNLRQINQEIARQRGHNLDGTQQSATSIASEFSDSSMDSTNTHPALIEGGPRNDASQDNTKLNETTSAITDTSDPREAEALQAVRQEASTMPPQPEDNMVEGVASGGDNSGVTRNELEGLMGQITERLDDIEKKVKSGKDKETVMLRMAKRYDMSEAEIVKALESAGERKRKREEKKKDQQKDSQK